MMSTAQAFAACLVASALTATGFIVQWEPPGPHWDCAAEDEVVVIDGTCRHVDELDPEAGL